MPPKRSVASNASSRGPTTTQRFWQWYVKNDCELTGEEMKRLGDHKYSAVDTSYLDELCMKRFWESVVPLCPLWLAPNLITLIGLIINLGTCLILSYFSYSAREPAPSWAYAVAALGLFLYQTLDAIDGKQARRTNSSSPLGELFDHGCDAVSQVFVTLNICYALSLGKVEGAVLAVNVLSVVIFYCAHWSTYCTGQLRFARFDVTEAQMMVISVLLTTALFGDVIWATEIAFGFTVRFVTVAGSLLTSLFQIYKYLNIIFSEGVGKNGSTVADTSVLFPLFPLLLVCIPFCMIYARADSQVYVDNITLFTIVFGAVSSKMAMRVVVAHMSKSELILWDWIYLAPITIMFNQYYNYPFDELNVLTFATVYAWASLLVFSVMICRQFCEFLNINCFVLGPRNPPTTTKAGKRH
ncbi:hypothetical protein PENTCL1PPCAC_29374 [Pristionchus entomophagus]|uniref:diacylglycerol cholinephosphotransferase n=1 Tax=Pristionchus entomophagus TaxID=358040 RepID=A0AAV5UMT0_9BILA|nr:hypothetical protein PENTCL1PPCAC_29374 [Pristionchus entomophagus]